MRQVIFPKLLSFVYQVSCVLVVEVCVCGVLVMKPRDSKDGKRERDCILSA